MPCALNPFRCCTLLRWIAMFNIALTSILFVLYAAGAAGVPAVLYVFAVLNVLLGFLCRLPDVVEFRTFSIRARGACRC